MSAIRPEELFDFDGFIRRFAEVEGRNDRFAENFIKAASAMREAWKGAISDVTGDLKTLLALMKSTNMRSSGGGSSSMRDEINENISALERYKKALASVENLSELNAKTVSELRAGVSALKTQYDNLDPSSLTFVSDQRKIAQSVKEATEAMNLQNQAMKAATRSVGEVNNTYNKLSRQTAELKNQLRNMPGAFDLATGAINKHNVMAVQMQRQIDLNDKALKRMDASMGNYQRNVGNYSAAVGNLKMGLMSIAAPILGVASAYEALHASVRVIDDMARLRLSLEAVSNSSDQVSKRWVFLSNLADKTGQDVSSLAANYVNFAGATRNTSLEGAKGDAIFKSFSNTFAALGKSSDVANRGLYALQQMISKGKVSSEELNQQLAEALPGANKLFADALHVSTMQLADMMKKGEVLATDVLPKVAAELEKIYGDRGQKNIQTISGSWTRVQTQWKLFLDMLNKDNSVSSFFARINNGLADTLRGLSTFKTDLNEVITRYRELDKNQDNGQNIFGGFIPGYRQARNLLKASTIVGNEDNRISGMVGRVQSIEDNKTRIDIIMKEQRDLQKLTKAYEDHKEKMRDVVIASADMKTESTKLFNTMSMQRRLVEALAAAEQKRATTVKERTITDPALPADDEKEKRKLTAWEKLIKQAEKYRGVLVDDLLADAKAGRALEVSDEALEKWNKLYELINKVATATGDQIPSNLRELNDKLNKNPTDIANQIQIQTLPSPESAPKGPNADPVIDLTKWNALLGVHEAELSNMAERLMTGSLKRFSDEYAKQLMDQLKIIQDLEKQASIAQNEQEKAAINERIGLAKQEFDEKMRLAREEVQAKKELQNQLVELAQVSVDAIFKIGSDQRAADIEANQAQMDHELSLVQGNEQAQSRIKKEYAKKDLELRQKQARADKAQAAFSIGISTARAVVNALATSGPPWIGIAMAAIVGAMGAIQLAAVLAKPLPQFYKGTQNAPEGLAEVGERGPELRESKGKFTLYEKPTVAYLNRGDKIYTAGQTRDMLSRADKAMSINSITSRGSAFASVHSEVRAAEKRMFDRMVSNKFDYSKIRDAVADGLSGLPVNEIHFDERGFGKRTRTKNGTTEYINNRYSL